jgi:hypothetical protein
MAVSFATMRDTRTYNLVRKQCNFNVHALQILNGNVTTPQSAVRTQRKEKRCIALAMGIFRQTSDTVEESSVRFASPRSFVAEDEMWVGKAEALPVAWPLSEEPLFASWWIGAIRLYSSKKHLVELSVKSRL